MIEIEVQYRCNTVCVLVRDNGCGISPEAAEKAQRSHWGLRGMRERGEDIGAHFGIWSRPGFQPFSGGGQVLSRDARENESRTGANSCPPSPDFDTCRIAQSRRRPALRDEVLFHSPVRTQAKAEDCLAIDVFGTRSKPLGRRVKA